MRLSDWLTYNSTYNALYYRPRRRTKLYWKAFSLYLYSPINSFCTSIYVGLKRCGTPTFLPLKSASVPPCNAVPRYLSHRLCEARARLEMREECTAADANDVIDLMRWSMVDTYSDGRGSLDFSRCHAGSGMSNRAAAKKFIPILQRAYERRDFNALFTVQDMRDLATQAQVKVADFEGFIVSLNDQGYLLKKGPRLYRLQTVE